MAGMGPRLNVQTVHHGRTLRPGLATRPPTAHVGLLVLPLLQEGPFIHSGGILGYLIGMSGSQLVQRCAGKRLTSPACSAVFPLSLHFLRLVNFPRLTMRA